MDIYLLVMMLLNYFNAQRNHESLVARLTRSTIRLIPNDIFAERRIGIELAAFQSCPSAHRYALWLQ